VPIILAITIDTADIGPKWVCFIQLNSLISNMLPAYEPNPKIYPIILDSPLTLANIGI
jgi:hypothetical protein